MSKVMSPDRIMNGTFGSVNLDGDDLAEATKFDAKVTINKEEVKRTGTLQKGYKITGTEGKGNLTLNKVDSRIILLLSDDMKNGKSTPHTLTGKLDDPDSPGTERIQFSGVIFDELTLMDWEAGKLGEVQIPFTFEDWDVLEYVEPA